MNKYPPEPSPQEDMESAARYDELLRQSGRDHDFEACHAEVAETIRFARDVVGALQQIGTSPAAGDVPRGRRRALRGFAATDIPPLPTRFRVLEHLGSGTFGIVVRAWDDALRRDVAIKMPHPELCTTAGIRERFLRESRAAARLNHPHIVRVLDGGTFEGLPFLVSEFVAGQPLSELLRNQGRIAPRAAARLIASLADGVQHAHERGVLHRDIKPDNILLERSGDNSSNPLEGVPRLTDFGLARIMDDQMQLSTAGTLVGTPRYMAPEQLAANTTRQTAATDIFSLGVVLYEMLAGTGPFSHLQTIQQRLLTPGQSVTIPPELRRHVPRDLLMVCLKCLEPDPEARYSTAAGLRNDLQCCLEGRPTLARPLTVPAQCARWGRQHRSLAAALATLVLCCLSIAAITGYSWSLVRRQNASLQDALQESRLQTHRVREFSRRLDRERARAQTNEARYQAAALLSALQQAYRARNEGQILEAARRAARARQLVSQHAAPPELVMLEAAIAREFRRAHVTDFAVFEHTVIPESDTIVAAGDDGKVRLLRADGSVIRTLQLRIPQVHAIAATADGTRIVAGGTVNPTDDTAWIVIADSESGEELNAFPASPTTIESLAVSADGRRILCGPRYQNIRLFDGSSGTCRLLEGDRRNQTIHLSAAGSRAVYTRDREHLISTSLIDESDRQVISVPGGIVAFDVHPTRQLAVCIQLRSLDLVLVDLMNGQRVAVLQDAQPWAGAVRFSRDGEQIACGALDGTVRVWALPEIAPLQSSGQTRPLTVKPSATRQVQDGRVVSVSWTSDHRVVTSGEDGTISHWRPEPHVGDAESRHWSDTHLVDASSTALVAARTDRSVRMLRQTPEPQSVPGVGGQEDSLLLLQSEDSPVSAVALAHSGRRIAVGFESGEVRFLSRDGDLEFRAESSPQTPAGDGNVAVMDAVFSWDERRCFWTGQDGAVQMLAEEETLPTHRTRELTAAGWTVDVSGDDRFLAVGGAFEHLLLLDPTTLDVISRLFGGPHCLSCRFCRRQPLLLSSHSDGSLRTWSVPDGQLLSAIRISSVPIWDFALSSDERIVVALSESGDVVVVDLQAAEIVGELASLTSGPVDQHRRPFLAVLPPGNRIVAGVCGPDGRYQHAEWPFPAVDRASANSVSSAGCIAPW